MRVIGLLGLMVLALLLAPAAAEEKKGKLDPAKLVGTWTYVSGMRNGKEVSADDLKKGTVEITKDTITLKSPDGNYVIKYELDQEKKPCQIKMEITEGPQGQGSKSVGIIAMKGGQLQLCYPPMGGDTPTEFAAKEGSNLHLFVLKHKK
jgi:uncharacterized protein (TIGR03067 family)